MEGYVGVVRELRDEKVGKAIVVVILKCHAHAGKHFAVAGQSRAGIESAFGESAVAVVMKEKLIGDVAGHKNVRETVAIVIGESNSQAVAFSRCDAGGDADVFKCAVTAIVIQDVRDSGKFGGWAVHGIFVAAGFAVRHGPIDV